MTRRITIGAIALVAAALVAVPTIGAIAQPDPQTANATCPYDGEADIDHQAMHDQMIGMMQMMGQMGPNGMAQMEMQGMGMGDVTGMGMMNGMGRGDMNGMGSTGPMHGGVDG